MAKPEKNDAPALSTTSATANQSSLIPDATPTPPVAAPASTPVPTEAELRERAERLAELEKSLLQRQKELDSNDASVKLGAAASPSTVTAESTPTVTVVNNAAFAIGLFDGTPLKPGINTVSRATWAKLFQKDGKPVPGARQHFEPEGGGRPDLQLVTLDNLSQLPDTHALSAISASTDATRLGQFEQTESRPTVKAAISERIADLKKAKASRK